MRSAKVKHPKDLQRQQPAMQLFSAQLLDQATAAEDPAIYTTQACNHQSLPTTILHNNYMDTLWSHPAELYS